MPIQVWSTSSRNLIGEYPTEDEALRAIRRDIDRLGRDCTRDLVMGDPEVDEAVVKGAALARRALSRFPERLSA